jgi:hypothetical protein
MTKCGFAVLKMIFSVVVLRAVLGKRLLSFLDVCHSTPKSVKTLFC